MKKLATMYFELAEKYDALLDDSKENFRLLCVYERMVKDRDERIAQLERSLKEEQAVVDVFCVSKKMADEYKQKQNQRAVEEAERILRGEV